MTMHRGSADNQNYILAIPPRPAKIGGMKSKQRRSMSFSSRSSPPCLDRRVKNLVATGGEVPEVEPRGTQQRPIINSVISIKDATLGYQLSSDALSQLVAFIFINQVADSNKANSVSQNMDIKGNLNSTLSLVGLNWTISIFR